MQELMYYFLRGMFPSKGLKKTSWIDNIDIKQEYNAICRKKSNLSKKKRDIVVHLYKKQRDNTP